MGRRHAPPAHARELFLDVVDDVVDGLTDLALRLAEALAELAGGALAAALGLELRIVDGFARLFLHVAFRFFGLPTNLVAIHARPPFRIAPHEKFAAIRKKVVQGHCQWPALCRSATRVSAGFLKFRQFARQRFDTARGRSLPAPRRGVA